MLSQKSMENIAGFLLINKEANITSYDCIRYIKKFLTKNIKIGHAGTLDPFATGLLIIAIGKKYTQQLNNFIKFDKEYIAIATLGKETDTLDCTGNVTNISNIIITKDDIELAAEKIRYNYIQTPPIYSAKKYNGQNLYSLARNNKLGKTALNNIVKNKAKKVEVYNLEILDFNYPNFEIKTKVSSGTYIRSLINDLAKPKSFATTQTLKRTKIGDYTIENSISLSSIKTLQDLIKNLKI